MPGPAYLSLVEIPGDGVTTQHEFSFAGGYISRTHVKARITNAGGAITPITVTNGMFVNDFTLNLGVPAPVGGVTRIYRETPRNVPLVDFAGGSRLTEANLDLATRQALFVSAEAFDFGDYAGVNDLLLAAGQSAASAAASALAADADATAASLSADAASASAVLAADTVANKLEKSANLSDLTNVPTARSNLGLGSAATRSALGTAGSLYSRDSILAAVGQSAGVPTGGVIERGSNANGEYVKFADGTMICVRPLTTALPTNVAAGPLFQTAVQGGSWAATFIAAPMMFTNAQDNTVANCWAGSGNPSTVGFGATLAFSAANTATCKLAIAAIGRWF